MFVYMIGLFPASLTDIVAPLLKWDAISPIGDLIFLIWVAGLSYSIVKHRFLIISPAAAAENIIATMSDLLILTDNRGHIVRVNRAVEECLGYKAHTVNSGERAVEFFKDQPVDLVILDMLMEPGMDGLETYRRIATVRPQQKVIIASGYSENERIHAA